MDTTKDKKLEEELIEIFRKLEEEDKYRLINNAMKLEKGIL